MKDIVQPAWNASCTLGESPIWHPTEKVVYWVDIIEQYLHSYNPETQQHHAWQMPTNICCLAPNATGGLIAAMRDGISILNPISTDVRYIAKLSESQIKVMMCNDGHCDRQGHFWMGTKDLQESNPVAEIFQLQGNQLISHAKQFTVSNGLIWSLDSRYCYIADSPKRIIYRYGFEVSTGALFDPIVFAKIPDDAGYPDGMTIDSEGCIWGAHFNGWRVTRYFPDGTIDRTIKIPTQAPTSCCLGGPDLKTLYVTSAKRDVMRKELAQQPLAGALFAITVDVPGVPEPVFKGV